MRMINNLHAEPSKIITSLHDLIQTSAERFGDKTLYYYKDGGSVKEFSYNMLLNNSDAVGTALALRGLMGKRIAVIGDTHPDYITAYFAVVNGNGVIVPLDKELNIDELCGFLELAECEAIFYTAVYNNRLTEIKDRIPFIKYFFPIHEGEDDKNDNVVPFATLLAEGKAALAAGNTVYTSHAIDMEAMCAIIFTSGTTGTSKGVMLSQHNLTAATNASCQSMCYDYNNTYVSCLPPHHTYEMTCGHLAILNLGASIFINDSLKYVLKNFAYFKPNALMLVPLFVETMHKKIWEEIRKRGMEKKVRAAMVISDALCAAGIDKRDKFFGQITGAFGGNLKSIVVGGAPISPTIIKDFYSFGVTVLEGYGITECAPLVAVNRPGKVRLHSVGTAVKGCVIKIDYDEGQSTGEILVKGENVMLGYYKNEEATKAVFTEDGYFRTGDIGYMDKEGYVFITGRKKNVIILSNGKNVFPEEVEGYLTAAIPEISEVVVLGRKNANGETVVTSIIVPNMDMMQGKNFDEVYTFFKDKVNLVNKKLPIFKQVKDVDIRYNEFEKNPSKKIKRYLIS